MKKKLENVVYVHGHGKVHLRSNDNILAMHITARLLFLFFSSSCADLNTTIQVVKTTKDVKLFAFQWLEGFRIIHKVIPKEKDLESNRI